MENLLDAAARKLSSLKTEKPVALSPSRRALVSRLLTLLQGRPKTKVEGGRMKDD
jgi:hypothetical protein